MSTVSKQSGMLVTSQGFSCDIMVLIYSKWRVDQAARSIYEKTISYLLFLYSNKTLYTSLNILSTCILSEGETILKQKA